VINSVVPAGSAVVSCAAPPLRGTVAKTVPFAANVTDPVGPVGVPAIVADTIAVNVTVWFGVIVGELTLTTVADGCRRTVIVRITEVAAANSELPAWLAVTVTVPAPVTVSVDPLTTAGPVTA
jgi:hypothetical protein